MFCEGVEIMEIQAQASEFSRFSRFYIAEAQGFAVAEQQLVEGVAFEGQMVDEVHGTEGEEEEGQGEGGHHEQRPGKSLS